jgi:hypothetical protein
MHITEIYETGFYKGQSHEKLMKLYYVCWILIGPNFREHLQLFQFFVFKISVSTKVMYYFRRIKIPTLVRFPVISVSISVSKSEIRFWLHFWHRSFAFATGILISVSKYFLTFISYCHIWIWSKPPVIIRIKKQSLASHSSRYSYWQLFLGLMNPFLKFGKMMKIVRNGISNKHLEPPKTG